MSWKRTPLTKVSEVVTKGTTPTTLGKQFVSSGIPFLRAQNINGSNIILNDELLFIDEATNKLLSRSKIKSNDVLLSIAGSIGRSAVVPEHYPLLNCNQAIAIIRLDTDIVSPYFLKYWLDTEDAQRQIYGAKVTATISNLSLGQIKKLEIPLPPLPEQKRIAAILDKADAIRRKRQQAIKLADEFLRATFLDMFGDPVTNPKGWLFGTIREIISEAKYGTAKKASVTTGKYPILRMNNVTYSGDMDLSDLKYIDLEKKEETKYLAKKGDLLFNRTNSKELVGKTAVFESSTPMAIAGYLIRVRTNERSTPHYISSYLNSSHGKATLLGMCKSIVGMANINAQELQDISIMIPPVDLQKQYTDLVWEVQERKRRQLEATKIGDTLFNSLTQRAFRGEL